MTPEYINQAVLSLDLENLTESQVAWLHNLKTIAQQRLNREFLRQWWASVIDIEPHAEFLDLVKIEIEEAA